MYIRVERNGKYENCSFTDLTEIEQRHFLAGLDLRRITSMCLVLADELRGIAEELDLYREN